jgi:hypothetical protein
MFRPGTTVNSPAMTRVAANMRSFDGAQARARHTAIFSDKQFCVREDA